MMIFRSNRRFFKNYGYSFGAFQAHDTLEVLAYVKTKRRM